MQNKKILRVNKMVEISLYRKMIIDNLSLCTLRVEQLIKRESALEFFKKTKYEKTVIDPLTGEPENLIEVINQCQTYLVSLMGAKHLLATFPDKTFVINLGNVSGYDIESEDGTIIAECFAATSFRSNSKLTKDLKRLSENQSALRKYEFFYDTEFTDTNKIYYQNKYPDIEIVHFQDVK